MRIATMAHRIRWGDIIWLTSVEEEPKRTRTGHGSACILATKFAFKVLQVAAYKRILRRGHIDVELLRWLKRPGEAEAVGASYVYPPMGTYTEHASECDLSECGGDKTRPSGQNSGEKACHGTRLPWDGEPEQRYKRLYQWNSRNDPKEHDFVEDCRVHTEEYHWISRRATREDPGFTCPPKFWCPDWGSNPGLTGRQRRLHFRLYFLHKQRIWAMEGDGEACTCSLPFLGSIFTFDTMFLRLYIHGFLDSLPCVQVDLVAMGP